MCVAGGERGSITLLALLGGGMALLVALVPVVVAADFVVSRTRAQVAADAAALAAVAEGRDAAARLAHANGVVVVSCCAPEPGRRELTVGVTPASRLLAAVVPRIEARAAAALVALHPAATAAPAVAGGVAAGRRVWPLRGAVTSGFGMRVHPLSGAARLHAGVDLGAAAGTPIAAASAGMVVAAGPVGGYGNTVDLRHADGTLTRYAHQSRILVRRGQQVAAGQAIGLVGSTGTATGPHLHFEVRTASGPIDPLVWFPR